MANEEQLSILKQGVATWNEWRSMRPSTKINLSSSNLQGFDLHDANFHKANLREVNLNGSNLSDANLGGANLRGANISKTNLSGSDFTGANLTRTDLRESNLNKTDFTGANLSDANLFRATIVEAQFSLANLSYANLNESNLIDANFTDAIFRGVTLKGVDISTLKLSSVQEQEIAKSMSKTERLDVIYDSLPNRIESASKKMESAKPNIVNKTKKVFFTAYHPINGRFNVWHTLLVYTHVSSFFAKVRNDAEKFYDQSRLGQEVRSKSSTQILAGTEITVIPSCEGIIFNPEHISFKWMENLHRADFRFRADDTLSDSIVKGEITIHAGPLIIGSLNFAMVFNEKETKLVEHEEHAKMYGTDDVFISYSRKDTEVAVAFKTVLSATGMDVFFDVDSLKSGQIWNKELLRKIERANIFQMFWSENYSQSENCRKEWKHALKQNKNEGYIRPVYWKIPISPIPPNELSKFNFKYFDLSSIQGK